MSQERPVDLASPLPALAPAPVQPGLARRVRLRLGTRSLVLVGMMGAGKSTVGRRLALRLGLPFRDADQEIEAAAGMPIADIFAIHGEPHFRDGERRVIARLLKEGAHVLATGGGAFMDPQTRAAVAAAGVSVWLKAELDVLMRRVRRRAHRPLLRTPDPEATMRSLMTARHPVYALADVTVDSEDGPLESVVSDVLRALDGHLAQDEAGSPAP